MSITYCFWPYPLVNSRRMQLTLRYSWYISLRVTNCRDIFLCQNKLAVTYRYWRKDSIPKLSIRIPVLVLWPPNVAYGIQRYFGTRLSRRISTWIKVKRCSQSLPLGLCLFAKPTLDRGCEANILIVSVLWFMGLLGSFSYTLVRDLNT